MGLWKGKKGSSVFYKIWNSNNKEKQGIREYQPEISNPQTNAQTDQRMRMLPAQLVKGALRDIVSRSFQGVEYGSKSRIEFLKYALRAEIFPYLPKGWTDPVPGSYLISRGTLPAIGVYFTEQEPGFATSLTLSRDMDIEIDITTVGELSADLIANNENLKEGDQLTFVICEIYTAYLTKFTWYTMSINLDTMSTEIVLPGNGKVMLLKYGDTVGVTGSNDNGVACGVIHSRLGSDGLYLRSTSELALARDWNDEFDSFFTTAAKGEARQSYQKKTGTSSTDWPVDDGDNTRGGTPTEDGAYMLSGLTGDLESLNGQQVKVRVMAGTDTITAVYIRIEGNVDYLVDINGNELVYFVEGVGTNLRKDQVPALVNMPTIVYTNASTRAAMAAEPADDEKPEAAVKKTRSKK